MHTSAFKCYRCIFSRYWLSKMSSTLPQILPWSPIFQKYPTSFWNWGIDLVFLDSSERCCFVLLASEVASTYACEQDCFSLNADVSSPLTNSTRQDCWKVFCAQQERWDSSLWLLKSGTQRSEAQPVVRQEWGNLKRGKVFSLLPFWRAFSYSQRYLFWVGESSKSQIVLKKNTCEVYVAPNPSWLRALERRSDAVCFCHAKGKCPLVLDAVKQPPSGHRAACP